MYGLLKKVLPALPSVPGFEAPVREAIKEYMTPLVDTVEVDVMGNLICLKKGTAAKPRRVLLAAHMDEIGFMVTFIEESGMVRVAPMGGIGFATAVGNVVVFGNGAKGVLMYDGDVKRGETPKAEKCYVDIGALTRKEAERRVKVGDVCALPNVVHRLCGSRVAGRPMDDRTGCAVMMDIARRLTAPADDIYYVFSVQEEVGCRGAAPAAFAIKPELALVFDVTLTGDTPACAPMAVKLGKGTAVKIMDRSAISDVSLVEELLATAKRESIPVQCEILDFGGTDASYIQKTGLGCRTGAISIPSRYVHTGVEMVDLNDMRATADLAVCYLGGQK